MLQYIGSYGLLDPCMLGGFPDEVFQLLAANTYMPAERMERIAETTREKLKYLMMFYNARRYGKRKSIDRRRFHGECQDSGAA